MPDNPLISEPVLACFRRRGRFHPPVTFSILLLLALFLTGCRDRRAAPASVLPVAATPPPAAEPVTPATLLDEAAYLHRIGDYSQEQRLLQTLLADLRTEPAQGRRTPAASRTQERAAILYRLALAYLADDSPELALDALARLRRMGDSLAAARSVCRPRAEKRWRRS